MLGARRLGSGRLAPLWSRLPAPAAAATATAAATAVTIAFQGFQFTPGGLGLYETSLTGILVVLGVDPAAGLSLALTTHALKFAYSYVAGAVCLGALAFADVLGRAGRSSLRAAPAGHGTALRTARP